MNMPSRKVKILLVGSDGFNASNESAILSSIPWKAIGTSLNLRDFDTIVLNLLSLDNETRAAVDWGAFCSILNFSVAKDVLLHNGKIIVIGDPRFTLRLRKDNAKQEHDTELPFLFWTGLIFKWDGSNGDTKAYHDTYDREDYTNFVKSLKRWNYSLDNVSMDTNIVRNNFNVDTLNKDHLEVECKVKTIVENRYRNKVVFEVRINIHQDERYGNYGNIIFGPILFLPRISASEDETVQTVLRDLCGFEAALPEPTWIKDILAPKQKQVDEKILRLETEVNALQQRLSESFADREKCRACLKLLYEREFELEPEVREVLRALGANVEDPKEENKEDGWITVVVAGTTYEGVLEIKSTKNDSFTEEGRKQLLDWVDRGRTLRGKNYKGIFIGNSAVNKPVEGRQDPFSDNWKTTAALSEICAMTTADLYAVYICQSLSLLDVAVFWHEVFSTNGIFDAKKYHEAHAARVS